MQNAGEISQLGGRRYFYYTLTSKAAGEPRSDLRRLPASEIKSRVLGSISEFLSNSLRVVEQFPALAVRDTKLLTSAAQHRATLLAEVRKKKKAGILDRAVCRVIVAPTELQIETRWLKTGARAP